MSCICRIGNSDKTEVQQESMCNINKNMLFLLHLFLCLFFFHVFQNIIHYRCSFLPFASLSHRWCDLHMSQWVFRGMQVDKMIRKTATPEENPILYQNYHSHWNSSGNVLKIPEVSMEVSDSVCAVLLWIWWMNVWNKDCIHPKRAKESRCLFDLDIYWYQQCYSVASE